MTKEIEIKLVGAPQDVMALSRSLVIRALAVTDEEQDYFWSTYFDAGAGALRANGVSLRLVARKDARIQTVKVEGAGGAALARREYEKVLEPGEPFPAATGADEIDRLIDAHRDQLQPTMRIETRGTEIILKRRGAKIAASFDQCRAEPGPDFGDGDEFFAFAEAELELIKGNPRELFAVARLLLEEGQGALRLGAISKEKRSRLAFNDGPSIGPANRVKIEADGSAGAALGAGLQFCAARLIELTPAIAEEGAVEGVRQMRVAMRRLRALERIYRKAAKNTELRAIAARAKTYAGVLGAARDWDVFVGETLPEIARQNPAPEGLDDLIAAAEGLRTIAWDEARAEIASAEFSAFCLDLLELAHSDAWEEGGPKTLRAPVTDFAARALSKRLSEAQALAVDLDQETPAAGHPLRIALKKLRYSAQLFRGLFPAEARKPYMRALSRLQDDFGVLNDAVVAQDLANLAASHARGAPGAARAAGFVCGYRAAHAHAAAVKIIDDWRAFDAMAPFWLQAGLIETAEQTLAVNGAAPPNPPSEKKD